MVSGRFWQKQGMWGSGTGLRRQSPGGGGIIRLPTKMKKGVPKNLCYVSWVTEELFGSWIFDDKSFQVFRGQGAGDSAFHLDPSDQTTVKLPFRFGFV